MTTTTVLLKSLLQQSHAMPADKFFGLSHRQCVMAIKNLLGIGRGRQKWLELDCQEEIILWFQPANQGPFTLHSHKVSCSVSKLLEVTVVPLFPCRFLPGTFRATKNRDSQKPVVENRSSQHRRTPKTGAPWVAAILQHCSVVDAVALSCLGERDQEWFQFVQKILFIHLTILDI